MSDAIEENTPPAEPLEAASGRIGHQLAAAREQAGLSVEEVAANLRLSVRQVQALEADDMTALPGSAFVRGFIRNYAKLLNLDADALLETYRSYAPDASQKAISLHSENIPILTRDKKAWLPYAVASAVVAVALGGWMFYMEHPVSLPALDKAPVAPPVQSEPPAPEPAAASSLPSEIAPLPLDAAAAPAGLSEVAATPLETPPVAPAPTARLRMQFAAPSWISVTDRDGKELFNKSQGAGTDIEVEGVPPLGVVVGNAGGVQLSYNGKPVDLAPHARANVARLTLE